MYKLKIFSIGKTKEPWLKQAIEEYSRRLRPILSTEWHFSKDNDELFTLLSKDRYVALDPKGQQKDSVDFANWLLKTFEKEHSRLQVVIGGAEGLTPQIIEKAQGKISLSLMTFTHQFTRLIFLEQVYRAFEIAKGSKYHK